MFSTSQNDFLESFIPTLSQKGYKYYVAYTNTRTNGGSYYSVEPDLYIVASDEEISSSSGYQYSIPSGSVRYAVRTSNYSTNNSAVNSERVVCEDFSGNLNIDVYEHIYSNAEFAEGSIVMPDINYRGGGELIEKTNGLGLVCVAVLLFMVFCSFFKR